MNKDSLIIQNLCGGYQSGLIIKNISFTVKQGGFTSVIGPNGSGKTTLLRIISKVLHPRNGMILLESEDISKICLKDFCKKVAFVSSDITVNFPFSVWEIVSMGRIPHLKRMQQEKKEDLAAINAALVMTDTVHLKDKSLDEISAGEKQRVFIARALAQEPQIVLLDEPTSHLDIGHQIHILDLLTKLNREKKLTIIMALHDLNLASQYCDQIILLDNGKIFKSGPPEEVLTYQNIENVYRTTVVVKENPLNSKPYVVLVPSDCKK